MTYYRWDDTSAPSLTFATGSMISVLDAVLVNGYGSKSAAGWSKVYIDAPNNTAVYRAPSGNRYYLRVADISTQYSRNRGYETMTDVNTGTNPFPSTTLVSDTNCRWWKGNLTNSYVPWIIVATSTYFYMYTAGADLDIIGSSAVSGSRHLYFFGDFEGVSPTDVGATSIIVGTNTTYTAANSVAQANYQIGGTTIGHYIVKSTVNSNNSYYCSRIIPAYGFIQGASGGSFTMGGVGPAFPYEYNSAMLVSPIYIADGNSIRGKMPGIYAPIHYLPGNPGDTIVLPDSNTYMLLDVFNPAQQGRCLLRIT